MKRLQAVWFEFEGSADPDSPIGPLRNRITLENGELYVVQHIDNKYGGETQIGAEKWFSRDELKSQLIDCESPEQSKQIEYMIRLFDLLSDSCPLGSPKPAPVVPHKWDSGSDVKPISGAEALQAIAKSMERE